MTCGDDAGKTDVQWREIISSRDMNYGLAFTVIMPNTYVLMKGFDTDSTELEEKKIEASGDRLKNIADAISNYEPGSAQGCNDVTRGNFAYIKSRIIYPWFVRHAMSPKPFHATDECTGCGLCAKSCPLGNITIIGHQHPRWSSSCALCLRCYHICPHHAVAYGNKTNGKGQYRRFLK